MRERLGAAFRTVYRYARRFAVTIGIIVAVLVVSILTIDLGPALKARADWLVCKDVCIPETANLQLNLPVASSSTPSRHAVRFA